MVSSYATDDSERLLLFDPLGAPEELLARAADRDTAIVLTAPWHERDSQSLVERLGRAGRGREPGRRLAAQGGHGEAHVYEAGDRLPGGIEFSGDTLVDFGRGLEINERWLELLSVMREQVVEGLRPLLGLPVEHVLATHGGPFDRAALERALS